MSNSDQNNKSGKKHLFGYTSEEKEKMRKELMTILRRCADGTATEQEQRIADKLNAWMITDAHSKNMYPGNPRDSIARGTEDVVWKNLSRKYGLDGRADTNVEAEPFPGKDYPKFAAGERTWQQPVKMRKAMAYPARRNRVLRYGSAAAMVAVILGAVLYFTGTKSFTGTGVQQVYVASVIPGEEILPDGTNVQLNQGSKLKLAGKFNREVREVSMEGQIFFDVAKDPEKPFIIRHGALTTKVSGTSFDIKAYSGLNVNTITVRTGRVEVSLGAKLLAVLTPGEQLDFHILTGKYEVKNVKWTETIGWMDGRLILDNADLNDLKLQIRQWFGKELVVTEHTFDDNVRLYSSFDRDATLDDVMERLGILYGVRYTIDSSRVILYR